MSNSAPDPSAWKLWRFLVRKERWGLSWRGWVAVGAFIVLAGFWLVLRIHPFLAVTHRVSARILVVEGWTDFYGVDAAVKEFNSGRYGRVLTTGGPEVGMGPSSAVYDTEAWQSAELLEKAGISAKDVQPVPSVLVGRDRTYNAALALRKWFGQHDLEPRSINVLTEDAHARRTWLLFQEALGPSIEVGIISVPNPDYDARHWWRSSDGVREVVDETVAYIYAKFFFWPDKLKD